MRSLIGSAVVCTAVAISGLTIGTEAHASLIGDQVTGEVQFGDTTVQGPANAIVGAGIEFDFGNVDIDVGSGGVQYFNIKGGTIAADESYVLSDLDWLDPGTSIVGVDSSFSGLSLTPNVMLAADVLTVTLLGGTTVAGGATVSVRFLTTATAVPEPSSLGLIGIGLFAAGGLTWRGRRSARKGCPAPM